MPIGREGTWIHIESGFDVKRGGSIIYEFQTQKISASDLGGSRCGPIDRKRHVFSKSIGKAILCLMYGERGAAGVKECYNLIRQTYREIGTFLIILKRYSMPETNHNSRYVCR
jgi:hypothetical protein